MFKWYITKKEDILNLIEYFKLNPSRSGKQNRLHLIPKYYKLKEIKAHKAPAGFAAHASQAREGSYLEKSWKNFLNNWLNYD